MNILCLLWLVPSVDPSGLSFPWKETIQRNESSILWKAEDGKSVTARLAFPARRILAIEASNRTVKFSPEDWSLSQDGLVVTFSQTRGLTALGPKECFPPSGSPNSYRHRVGFPDQNLLYGPGRWFHDRQVEITYETNKGWQGPKPDSQADLFPRTRKRLETKQPFILGISGDSISTGLDASALVQAPPNQPGYPLLLTKGIEEAWGSKITLVNRAVSGTSITHGIQDLGKMMESQPDLLLVAFGMNDVGRRDPVWFGNRMGEFLDKAKKLRPETEILLVAPMLGHKEWIHTPREMFFAYRDQMKRFVGPGVGLADVTTVWETYLKRKLDLDLTGNGLNHPNDFGHRLYAATLMTALGYGPK